MKFEDALPAIKAGRLARRASWPEGKCIGASEYGLRQLGTASNLNIFDHYDRNGSSRSFYYVGMDKDLLETDWELVPEIASDVSDVYYVRPILSELALRYVKDPLQNREKVAPDLSDLFGRKSIKAYKSGSVEDLLEALDVGIVWLMSLRRSAKD